MQRGKPSFFKQRFEHHVFATALGEALAILLSQRTDSGVAMLFFNFAAFVAVAAV
jgi:hypothetical protein